MASVVAVVLVAVLATAAAGRPGAAAAPADVGNWLPAFEQGGDATPLCTVVPSSGPYATELVCKPTAVTSVPLYDGRVLYWNGIEGSENVVENAVLEGGKVTRDDQSRVLGLAGGSASFTVPSPERGGAVNPEIALGNSPNDPWANDGGLFCTDQIQLADGRILAAGGTDFWDRAPGAGAPVDPADFLPIPPEAETIIELEGLRNARIFDPAGDTWTQTGHMNYGRWYPQLVTLPNGKVFVASGVKLLIQNTTNDATATNGQVRLTEIYDPATGVWTANETAKNDLDTLESLPLFPRMHLAPNGKIFLRCRPDLRTDGPGPATGVLGSQPLLQPRDEVLGARRARRDEPVQDDRPGRRLPDRAPDGAALRQARAPGRRRHARARRRAASRRTPSRSSSRSTPPAASRATSRRASSTTPAGSPRLRSSPPAR